MKQILSFLILLAASVSCFAQGNPLPYDFGPAAQISHSGDICDVSLIPNGSVLIGSTAGKVATVLIINAGTSYVPTDVVGVSTASLTVTSVDGGGAITGFTVSANPGGATAGIYSLTGGTGNSATAQISLTGCDVAPQRSDGKCMADIYPQASDDGLITLLNLPDAVHLVRFSCGAVGGTSVVVNLVKGGNSLLANQTCTVGDANHVTASTWVNTAGQCGGTASCGVAIHAPVTVHIGTITGTVNSLVVCADYTFDGL